MKINKEPKKFVLDLIFNQETSPPSIDRDRGDERRVNSRVFIFLMISIVFAVMCIYLFRLKFCRFFNYGASGVLGIAIPEE
jgi:hypothetical protein